MKISIKAPRLHPVQDEIRTAPARFKTIVCGRRWGKTRLGAVLVLETAVRGGVAWWVWPTHKLGRTGWKIMRNLGNQIASAYPAVKVREVDRAIVFPGGGEAQMRSAEDPASLVGEGLDRVVVDETGIIQERAWQESLRPALIDKAGDAFFLGTPKGKNWFQRLAVAGADPHESDWASWSQTTFDNPYLPDSEKERIKAEYAAGKYPERYWRQEIMAEFLDDAGAVFRRVTEAATAIPQEKALEDHEYVFGVDWGKHNDFTVITVIDTTDHALVYLDRFNQIDYAFQVSRLKALIDRFHPVEIVAERNSMGEPLVEQLMRDGLPVRPFTTTGGITGSKTAVIEGLSLAFEQGDLTIIPDDVLIGELQAFEMERLPSGASRYSAPSGLHDDCVMSAALAWSAVSEGAGVGFMAF